MTLVSPFTVIATAMKLRKCSLMPSKQHWKSTPGGTIDTQFSIAN
tara:strand:- start:155 stop:289 length:135 start_codon:yes stop_codon:yes gene_type:complete